jgi:hypothetical protein
MEEHGMGYDGTKRKMPGTKSEGFRSKTPRFNDAKFVNYELDKAQAETLKGHSNDGTEILSSVDSLLDDGYRLSVKFDEYSNCYSAFLQPIKPEGKNGGFILTGRGSSVLKAIKQCLYKHFVCLEGDWSEYVERRGETIIDD